MARQAIETEQQRLEFIASVCDSGVVEGRGDGAALFCKEQLFGGKTRCRFDGGALRLAFGCPAGLVSGDSRLTIHLDQF